MVNNFWPLMVAALLAAAANSARKKEDSTIEDVTQAQLESTVAEHDYVAVFWYGRRCKIDCNAVLHELENIDDDTDRFGVQFVKINDKKFAKKYGITEFPALTYFRNKEAIKYEGDLMDEEQVLDFLTSLDAMQLADQIEDVNAKILDKIVEDQQYVAVLFYKSQCRKCDRALKELENIDDEADQLGIAFVKINDESLADEYSLDRLPALVYYRNRTPIVYEGDLSNEEDVLDWLLQNMSTGDDDDRIEEVTDTILSAMIDSVDNLAVLFYDSKDEDSAAIIAELENIDDECDDKGIFFVKTESREAAKSYGITSLPALVYFENEVPNIFDGELSDEDEVLDWLLHHFETDEIEDISDEMLDKLVQDERHVAVLFYDSEDEQCEKVLSELENIDDECDKQRIHFVKIDDADEAKEYGIDQVPTLVYFEDGVPHVYDGDLMNEDEVLRWLLEQVENEIIEDVTDEMLDKLIDGTSHLAALFSEHDDVAVLFYSKTEKHSRDVVNELERIDDECDDHGIVFVKISNAEEAIEHGIEHLPTLVYFENEIPSVYQGDLMNEEEVLSWLVRQVTSDEIEEVTDEMLDYIVERFQFVAALFYEQEDREDQTVLKELEKIDDECDSNGIVFVKISNIQEAAEYGIDELPALVFFEQRIPSVYEGDLSNEDEILEWLVQQKHSTNIEEVTDEILAKLVQEHPYVAAYFSGPCQEKEQCHRFLEELENIDDDTDDYGIVFVTTEETGFAQKSANIKKFPALVLYRNGDPLTFTGKIGDEQSVLKWMTREETLQLADSIEEVNLKMLKKLIEDDSDDVVVYFYNKHDKQSEQIIEELEKIDHDTEKMKIEFLKCSDALAAKQYQLRRPSIVYFKGNQPLNYPGDLKDEDELMKWLSEKKDAEEEDFIEEVDEEALKKMIKEKDFLVVYFYEKGCKSCDAILKELEDIDDETDEAGIQFVKTTDTSYAKSLDIHVFPVVVYFEKTIPIVYNGSLKKKEALLQWILKHSSDLQNSSAVLKWAVQVKEDDSIDDVDRKTMLTLIDTEDYLAVFFYDNGTDSHAVLKYLEMIDEEADEYGIKIVKINDKIMAKKYGFREMPGLAYFRNTKNIAYEGDLYDDEEILDWLTDPANMELSDAIEKVNDRMFDRLLEKPHHSFAAFFYNEEGCRQCERMLQRLENIDDEAKAADIEFVKIEDSDIAREYGVFAVPAVVFFMAGREPVIYAGDTSSEERLLEWLLSVKHPDSDVIEEMAGDQLRTQIKHSESIAVYFYGSSDGVLSKDNRSCTQCSSILQELENIDDDTDRYGIKFVKTQDSIVAGSLGVTEFPALVYFEHQMPTLFEGDLSAEEDVLKWLILQKSEDTIETVNRAVLEQMIANTHYLVAIFTKPNSRACDEALVQLETIDDECDAYGLHMVKLQDPHMAKRYNINTLPAIVYFRNGNPLVFEGDVSQAQNVFEWLVDPENRKLDGEIEQINNRMLDRLLEESPFVVVLFTDTKEECPDCAHVLNELENIDEEASKYGIDFVRIEDSNAAAQHDITHLPTLAYFRKRIPMIYDGDLTNEQKVLTWLTSQDSLEIKNEIEEVNKKMLDKLLDEKEFVAVFFYKNDCEVCDEVLSELETIDEETDALDITFVKIRDARYAKKYGISKLPAVVYFRRKFPSIFRGDIFNEQEILEWLRKNRFKQPELNLFMYALAGVSCGFVGYTVLLVFFFQRDTKRP